MDKKKIRPSVWPWFGAMAAVIAVIAIGSYVGHKAPKRHMRSQPAMTTGALESTYNQVAGMMNNITVSIYDGSYGSTNPELLGSGTIIAKQYILTNAHIVSNRANIYAGVFSPQQASYPVEVYRSDPVSDLAILKVTNNSEFITAGKIGNSDLVDTGDIVFAMGNAFGNGNLLTYGMVVDKSFSYTSGTQSYTNILRTNINIYPGTCGGPLVNINGEVIGVNNSQGHSGTYIGIGYATPINRAVAIMNSNIPAPQIAPGGAEGGYQPAIFTPRGYRQGNPYSLV